MGVILGVGGAHVDRRGQVSGPFIPGASNPGTMGEEAGGGTFNALRVAVLRGQDGWLASVRGGDGAGELVSTAVAAAGLRDLSATFLDRQTPSYTALLDREGEVIAALADMNLYDVAFPRILRRSSLRDAMRAADAILTDANLPPEGLMRLASMAGGTPIFAVAISPAKAPRLKDVLRALSCLFMNRREAAALTGIGETSKTAEVVEALRATGLRQAVVTSGSGTVVAFDETEVFTLDPPAARRIADVTGAGDALAGAALAAHVEGLPFAKALRYGVAASLLAVESDRASASFTDADFHAALALVPEPQRFHMPATTEKTHVP